MSSCNLYLQNGDRVLVHSFGDQTNATCEGTVRGLSYDSIIQIYIVELDKPSPWPWEYDCITVPDSCLRKLDQPQKIVENPGPTLQNIREATIDALRRMGAATSTNNVMAHNAIYVGIVSGLLDIDPNDYFENAL